MTTGTAACAPQQYDLARHELLVDLERWAGNLTQSSFGFYTFGRSRVSLNRRAFALDTHDNTPVRLYHVETPDDDDFAARMFATLGDVADSLLKREPGVAAAFARRARARSACPICLPSFVDDRANRGKPLPDRLFHEPLQEHGIGPLFETIATLREILVRRLAQHDPPLPILAESLIGEIHASVTLTLAPRGKP